MRGMHLKWGSVGSAVDTAGVTSGSLVEPILLSAYLIVWSLVMAAYMAMFVLTGVATSLLVLIWFPCFTWSKVSPQGKSQMKERGSKARPIC